MRLVPVVFRVLVVLMTKLEAMRALVTKPREAGMGKIGRRVIYATSDGRERINFVLRILRSLTGKKAA